MSFYGDNIKNMKTIYLSLFYNMQVNLMLMDTYCCLGKLFTLNKMYILSVKNFFEV